MVRSARPPALERLEDRTAPALLGGPGPDVRLALPIAADFRAPDAVVPAPPAVRAELPAPSSAVAVGPYRPDPDADVRTAEDATASGRGFPYDLPYYY